MELLLILGFSFFNYNSKDNTYSIFQILYLLLCWLILFVGVGASALLSQQIILDSNIKYTKYQKKVNEESKIIREQKNEKDKKKEEELGELKNEEEKDINNLDKKDNIKDNENIKNKDKKDILDTDINENNINKDDLPNKILNIEEVLETPESNEKIEKINKIENGKDKNINNLNKEKIESKREKSKNKYDSFFTICLITIISYFLKYFINTNIMKINEMKLEEYKTYIGCDKNISCYDNIIKDSNLTISNNSLFENLKYKLYEEGFNSFIIIIIIYISCLAISIGLYSIFVCIFTQNEKEININGNKFRVCEIFGYTIYSENIVLNKEVPRCECCKLLCSSLKNCLCLVAHSLNKDLCNICGLPQWLEEGGCCYTCSLVCECYCCDCDACCHCYYCDDYSKYEIKDYQKNNEFFCYCYQAKRTQTWLNRFLTNDVQKKIFPYMIEYFILQILTLAFEKQYFGSKDESFSSSNLTNTTNITNLLQYNFFIDELNITNNTDIYNNNKLLNIEDLYVAITFSITFFFFIYFTFSVNSFINFIENDSEKKKKKIDKENKNNIISKVSNGILDGAHGILLFNGIFSLIFSSLYLSDSENIIFKNNILFLVPVLMNQFYQFTLIYYCISYSEEKKQFEIISSSTLISLYIFLWKIIISLIRDYSSLFWLYIIQIILSVFPCFFILIILILFIFIIFDRQKCGDKIPLICCYCSFIFCFGGFWFNETILDNLTDYFNQISVCNSDFNCNCNCCHCPCCDKISHCCFEFCDFLCCCDCCTCYQCSDCCGCC